MLCHFSSEETKTISGRGREKGSKQQNSPCGRDLPLACHATAAPSPASHICSEENPGCGDQVAQKDKT